MEQLLLSSAFLFKLDFLLIIKYECEYVIYDEQKNYYQVLSNICEPKFVGTSFLFKRRLS